MLKPMSLIANFITALTLCSCATTTSFTSTPNLSRTIAADENCIGIFKRLLKEKDSAALSAFESKLKSYGYSIKQNVLYKNLDNKLVKIGELQTITPKYLYEWQDKASHLEWMANGKITKEEMDYMLSTDGQTYGRGYYISTDPFDSQSYGSHLTIFEVNRPMIFVTDESSLVGENEALLNELRDIGFAGIKGTETWFNIFNEDYLSKALKPDLRLLDEIEKSSDKNISNQLTIGIQKMMLGTAPSPAHLKKLVKNFIDLPNFLMFKNADPKIMTTFFTHMDYPQLKKLINRPSFFFDADNQTYQNIFDQKSYSRSFFELFDLLDIATIPKNRTSIAEMLQKAKTYEESTATLKLDKIKTFEAFKRALNSTLDAEIKIRTTSRPLSFRENSNGAITVSEDTFKHLQFNSLINIKNKKIISDKEVQIDVTSSSLTNLPAIKEIIGEVKFKKINDIQDSKLATKMMIEALMEKFFDPRSFNDIALALLSKKPHTPLDMYNAFLSLQPFSSDNLHAANLYYKWIQATRGGNTSLSGMLFLKDSTIMSTNLSNFKPVKSNTWYATKIWVMSAATEDEMILRAQTILKNDPYHAGLLQDLLYLKDEIN